MRAVVVHVLLCAAVTAGTFLTVRAGRRFERATGASILRLELWPRYETPIRKDDSEEDWRARTEAFRAALRESLLWDTLVLIPAYGSLLLTVGRRLARSRETAARGPGRVIAWLSLAAAFDLTENALLLSVVDGGAAIATLEAIASYAKWLLLLVAGIALPLGLARDGGWEREAPTPWHVILLGVPPVVGILALAVSLWIVVFPLPGVPTLVAQLVGCCGSAPVLFAAVGGFLIGEPDDASRTVGIERVFR
jgi:hypothetical protein